MLTKFISSGGNSPEVHAFVTLIKSTKGIMHIICKTLSRPQSDPLPRDLILCT